MPLPTPKTRRHLSADGLCRTVRAGLERILDERPQPQISLRDALLSAFAMFSLKDPSLLAFDALRHDGNLQQLFGIGQVPCDTRMREILDPVDPERLRPVFNDVFRGLQRGKALEPLVFHAGCYLLALDGTGYFSSRTVHCDSCLKKTNSRTGEVTYSHQMLGAVLVHPDFREVIPLAPEPIIKQDGTTKNDCERNAAKRLLRKIRQEHPHLGLIVVEDGLASNAPHIRELQDLGMHFILGAKPGDHTFLFEKLIAAYDAGRVRTLSWKTPGGGLIEVCWTHDLPLNEANPGLLVNFLQYTEFDAKGNPRKTFSSRHRPEDHPPQRVGSGPRRPGSLEDRERNLQHAQESRLSIRAQLRTRRNEPVGGVRHADDAGLSGRSGSATVLPAVSSRLAEVWQQACVVGQPAFPLPTLRLHLPAASV